MARGKFVEAAHAFIRIMPEQREAVLQLTSGVGEKSFADSVAQAKAAGIAILFSRQYRARTVLVAVPWFLMDIATYGVGLFTPIILGAITISGDAGGVITRDFADARGSARHVGPYDRSWTVEFSRRRRTHSVGVRRFHPVQPADERRPKRHDVYARADPVPDTAASYRQRLRGWRCENRSDPRRLRLTNLKR